MRAGRGGGGFHDPFDIFREAFGGGSIFDKFLEAVSATTLRARNGVRISGMIWRSLLRRQPMV